MAYSLQNTTDLTALGNAIRTKTGGALNLTVAEMATAVAGITGGGGGSGWTPTTFTEITADAELGKYDGSIDLSSYESDPFIILLFAPDLKQMSSTFLIGCVGYWNGSSFDLFYGDTTQSFTDYSNIDYSNGVLSYTTQTTSQSRASRFFIIT